MENHEQPLWIKELLELKRQADESKKMKMSIKLNESVSL